MKEVMSGSESGKRLIQEIVDGIVLMLNDQDYQEAINIFNDDLDSVEDNTEDQDFDDFLGSLGIRRPEDDDED